MPGRWYDDRLADDLRWLYEKPRFTTTHKSRRYSTGGDYVDDNYAGRSNHTSSHRQSYESQTRPTFSYYTYKPSTTSRRKTHVNQPSVTYDTSKWSHGAEPICISSSIFDAASLGDWLYDWTCSVLESNFDFVNTIARLRDALREFCPRRERAKFMSAANMRQDIATYAEFLKDSSFTIITDITRCMQVYQNEISLHGGSRMGMHIYLSKTLNTNGDFVNDLTFRMEKWNREYNDFVQEHSPK